MTGETAWCHRRCSSAGLLEALSWRASDHWEPSHYRSFDGSFGPSKPSGRSQSVRSWRLLRRLIVGAIEFHPSSGSRSGRRAIRPEASGAVVHHAFSEALVSLTDWPTPIATMIIVSVTPSDSSHNVAATPGRLVWQPADRGLVLWSPPDDNGFDPLGCLERVFEFSESENLPAGLAELWVRPADHGSRLP